MKTIGIFTSNYGHESIAKAIAEKIEQNAGDRYTVKIFFQKNPVSQIYELLYKLSPPLIDGFFKVSSKLIKNSHKTRDILEQTLIKKSEKNIKSFIKRNKIALTISTFYACNPVLEKIQSEGVPFVNILPDPKTTYQIAKSNKAKLEISFDQSLIDYFQAKNMKKAGWFVGNKFEKKYSKTLIKKQLKLDDVFTILVVSGSKGAAENIVMKILPSIINCSKKVNFIVACGEDNFLYKNILGINQSFKYFSSSSATITPLQYQKDMYLYMQAADLVVGKAGPNTIFESVACEVPFFAITHVVGLEDGNLDVIRDYKIGIVEENAKRANKTLEQIIKNPKKLDFYTLNIKKLKQYNQNSINILLKEIDELMNKS